MSVCHHPLCMVMISFRGHIAPSVALMSNNVARLLNSRYKWHTACWKTVRLTRKGWLKCCSADSAVFVEEPCEAQALPG